MKKNELLEKFVNQFNGIISSGAETLNKEIQQKMRSAAQTAFYKLDLFSREEFDAQVSILNRTQEQLEDIKKQLSEIEENLSTKYR